MSHLVNICSLSVNTVGNNSSVTFGSNTNGDALIQRKSNQAFGAIYRNANLFCANYSLVFDPDIIDDYNMQSVIDPSFSNTVGAVS